MDNNNRAVLSVYRISGLVFWVTCILLLRIPDVSAQNIGTGDIVITQVTVSSTTSAGKCLATIVLNDCLKIKEIEFIENNKKNSLKFPYYVSKTGREYKQVIVHKTQLKDLILQTIKNQNVGDEKFNPLKHKITKLSLYRNSAKSKLKAFARVTFNDAVSVECKVMDGYSGLWVSWPSRPDTDEGLPWIKQVTFVDKEKRKQVEKELLARYQEAVKEGLDNYDDE